MGKTGDTLEVMRTEVAPVGNKRGGNNRGSRTGRRLGALAGLIGISCCVAPVAAVLLGMTTAAAAVDLGNFLYGEWGWAFKLAAVAFAVTALVVQRRKANAAVCAPGQKPNLKLMAVWMAGSGVAVYTALYFATKGLERLA